MRHALVPVHLMNSARSAAATSARYDAEPEPDDLGARATRRARRARRAATRTRRTRT
jgi:hypothetical protein